MAEYYLPYRTKSGFALRGIYGLRYVRTYAKKPRPRMDPAERIAKKKLNNPVLWAQLDAISKGTFVNHLGRRHPRRVEDHPYFR